MLSKETGPFKGLLSLLLHPLRQDAAYYADDEYRMDYYTTDHLGAVRVITDMDGEICQNPSCIQSCHAKISGRFTKLSCRVTRTISSLRFMIFVQESLRIFEDFLPQAGEPVGEGNRIESIGKVQ